MYPLVVGSAARNPRILRKSSAKLKSEFQKLSRQPPQVPEPPRPGGQF
jgi:hypothetical protein